MVVVFATPPFWLAKAIDLGVAGAPAGVRLLGQQAGFASAPTASEAVILSSSGSGSGGAARSLGLLGRGDHLGR